MGHPKTGLGPRLRAAASLVAPGLPVADVGTDHALLLVDLLRSGRVPRGVAVDIGSAPLAGARARLQAEGLLAQVDVRLGDGLAVLAPGEVGSVVIAGMGGRRIVKIVGGRPAVVSRLTRLVVQPNTEVAWVRAGLRDAGLHLVEERLVRDTGRWYAVLAWAQGEPVQPWTAADLLWGPLLRARRDPGLFEFLRGEQRRVSKATLQAGAAAPSSLVAELRAIEFELARLKAPAAEGG